MAQLLFHPATLILLAINSLPLAGVLFWGWDAFVLLMLYWLETLIIAFWTVVQMMTAPRRHLPVTQREGWSEPPPSIGVALFVMLHAGIFMFVHFLFLWMLFSGGWSAKVHGVGQFVSLLIVDTGMWLPLLLLFVGRGLVVLVERTSPLLAGRLRGVTTRTPQAAGPGTGAIVFGLYMRIIVMQITIIVGAWALFLIGAAGGLALLILIKTIADLSIQRWTESSAAIGSGDRKKP